MNNFLAFISIPITLLISFIFIIVVRALDVFETESFKNILKAFVYGMLSTILTLYLVSISDTIIWYSLGFSEGSPRLISAVIDAPVFEEISKGLLLLLFIKRKKDEIDTLADYLVYGTTIGLGFEFIENLFYITEGYGQLSFIDSWFNQLDYRLIASGGTHGFYTAWVGLGLWFIQRTSFINKKIYFISCLFIAITLHGINNFSAILDLTTIYNANYLLVIGMYMVLIFISLSLDISLLTKFSMKLHEYILLTKKGDNVDLLNSLNIYANPINHIKSRFYRLNKSLFNRDHSKFKEFSKLAFNYENKRLKKNSSDEFLIDQAMNLLDASKGKV